MKYSDSLILLIAAAAFLLFIRLGATTVFQIAEARNSQVPAEMIQRKDYTVPYFNGELRTDKPPLHYYAMLLCYKLAGANETGARFFSSVCGLLIIVATWFFAVKNLGKQTAWWASVMTLGSVHFIFQFRLATPDPYLIACHVLSLFCFWEGFVNGRKIFIWFMYVLWGLAFLAKGPVGIGLPAATIFFYLLFQRQFSLGSLKKLLPIQGTLISVLVALPWFYLVHQQTAGEWTRGFFLEHNVGRFENPVDGHKGPFILTWFFVLLGLFPFSVFLIRALAFSWKNRGRNPLLLFNLLAAAIIILPYSISATKLINYTSPAYPFLALTTGYFIDQYLRSQTRAGKLRPEWICLLILSCALPVGLYFWVHSEEMFSGMTTWSIPFAVLPFAVLAAFVFTRRDNHESAFRLLGLGAFLTNVFFFSLFFPALENRGSVSKLKGMVQGERPVIAYRKFNEAFTFYHKNPIPVMESAAAVNDYLRKTPSALVLERAGQPHLLDSIPHLRLIARNQDLFSRQHSFVYELSSP